MFKKTNVFMIMTISKNRKVQFNIDSVEYEKHSVNVLYPPTHTKAS